jgi:hypothetical protein
VVATRKNARRNRPPATSGELREAFAGLESVAYQFGITFAGDRRIVVQDHVQLLNGDN